MGLNSEQAKALAARRKAENPDFFKELGARGKGVPRGTKHFESGMSASERGKLGWLRKSEKSSSIKTKE